MTKQDIEEYISKHYDELLNLSRYITRGHASDDLLNDIILDLLTRKEYSQHLNNCYNLYNYFYAALRRQFYSNNSLYQKNYRSHQNEIYNEIECQFESNRSDEFITWFLEQEFFLDELDAEIKNNVKESTAINNQRLKSMTYKTIFLEYFFPIDSKPSLRLTADKYGISYSSVLRMIKTLIKQIKSKSDFLIY